MSMKMKTVNYGAPAKQILSIPDHYVAIGFKHAKAESGSEGLAVLEGSRYVVKAGTIYPSNDANAIGVVLNDYDVTDGDAMMAVVIHGFVKSAALPVAPAAAAIGALNQITFLPIAGIRFELLGDPLAAVAGGDAVPTPVVYELSGATFREGAETLTNWTFTNASTVKAEVKSIKVSEDKRTVTFNLQFVSGQSALAAGKLTAQPAAGIISIGKQPSAVDLLDVSAD